MFDPKSTYRIQLQAGFTLSHLERIIPYLHQLGVSTIYASPVFKAVPGSSHGYDGLNPHQINPEIGTYDQLKQIRWQLKERGMNWIQDIVPNHLAFHPGNDWLMDVLEKGQRSTFASFFDIDWNHSGHQGRLMVPFLGKPLDEVIENGELSITLKNKKLFLSYYDNAFPIHSFSYLSIINEHAPAAVTPLVEQIQNLDLIQDIEKHNAESKKLTDAFAGTLRLDVVRSWLSRRLQEVNSDKEIVRHIADQQYYRLCFWQETDHEINYRRFFTVNGLICLNIQDKQVFDKHHEVVKGLLEQDVFQGLRIDHIDGLYNPGEYLSRLRELSGEHTYTIVEKILAEDEPLPESWPIQGTSGYEFLAIVNNVMTQRKSETAFTRFYNTLSKTYTTVPQQMRDKKSHILYKHMAGELENLYNLFYSLHLADGLPDQPLPGDLKTAIGQFLIYCPVYRYYGDTLPLDGKEYEAVKSILTQVKEARPTLVAAVSLLEFVILEKPSHGDHGYNERAGRFYQRCMQFSGPLMAKGVEDTLMYTNHRFIGHNEVGDAVDAFGCSPDYFHSWMRERQQRWPLSLNGTSTHDTKRGEDARARLNVLANYSDQWLSKVQEWMELNKSLKGKGGPDLNDEYFIYQSIIATYPMPGTLDENYAERLQEYLQKALREGKLHSDWAVPNEEYEANCKDFAVALLDKKKPFWKSFEPFFNTIAGYGVLNSLTQVVLKFTCPGVPDVYQGCELWDLSFVDPDNRRPVPFEKNLEVLGSFSIDDPEQPLLENLWKNRFDGRIKMWLTHSLLKLRNQHADLFAGGEYLPLTVEGNYHEHIMAFARRFRSNWMIVVVPLHLAEICEAQQKTPETIDWKDTRILLPKDTTGLWEHALLNTTGAATGTLGITELFTELPFTIIVLKGAENKRSGGILMHITSLPSAFGIGDLGPEAYRFADFLNRCSQKYWQLLPVNPVEAGQGYSPYSATSSRAGNVWMISPERLVDDGLLLTHDLSSHHLPVHSLVDYHAAEHSKSELISKAWSGFRKNKHHFLNADFNQFCEDESEWLHDFALYNLSKKANGGKPWYEWDQLVATRDEKALQKMAEENAEDLLKIKWLQFIFFRQWHHLKSYCNEKSIKLIGDLPFYISYDSPDVWSHKEIFALDEKGNRTGVAGVPPDAFSDDGQLWGMPVFKWDVLKERNYDWWIGRLKKNREMFDIVRLDHFRAFSAYWDVPASEKTARNGTWKPGPGSEFFHEVLKQMGELPFLAEDLGEIDEPVYQLRDEFNFPGMKILQFAFGDDFPSSDYIPHNYTNNFFAYTGTHDNNTVVGWYRQEADQAVRNRVAQYLANEVTEKNVHYLFGRLAYASVANTVILPIQDVLGLDENARMNTPSSVKGNWNWRLLPNQLTTDAESLLKEWTYVYNRL